MTDKFIHIQKLYTEDKKRFIAYNIFQSSKSEAPCVIFLHGLMSNRNGRKSLYVENYCQKYDYNFIKFDNFGHGDSSGHFINENITSWIAGLELVINNLTNSSIILVASSMGAWLAMHAAIKFPNKIIGLINIAPAPDFTEELIWNKLGQEKQKQLEKTGICIFQGENPECNEQYPINYNFIIDGRKYLLLNQNTLNIKCPVHIIHGMKDYDVPYELSMRIAEKIKSGSVVIKLIKDADHRLSRPIDLEVIKNSLKEIISNT